MNMNSRSTRSGAQRRSGISVIVTALILVLAILLTAMCAACDSCGADKVIELIHNDSADSGSSGSYLEYAEAAVSGSDAVSDSDAGVTEPVMLSIPVDHEDVVFANYDSEYYIVVYTLNCSVLVLGKDENGKYTKTVKTFLCSTGSFENDTASNNGVYDICEKLEWRFMMDVYGHYCSRIGWGTGYLFHSVPFLKENDNRTLSSGYDKLGTNASHGCIRLCTRDAKWIYDNVPKGTQVHIVDNKNGPAGEPVPMRIKDDGKYYGWDPTDPDPANPYGKLDASQLTYFTHTSAGTQATTVATSAAE